MELAKLILDYIKTLIWPVMFAVILFSYKDTVLDLLNNREINAFGVSIGKRIDNISKNYETEIAELRQQIQRSDNNQVVLNKIDTINRNIQKDLSQIQQQSIESQNVGVIAPPSSAVALHERQGFEAILNQDVDTAIDAFSRARALWPDYHNVSELERLLKQRGSQLTDNAVWKQLRQLILSKYSWGMPQDLRQQFKSS